MYIPTTFMSSQGSCFNVTTSKLSGSGSISSGSFVSGGFVWDYYQFEMTDKENANLTSFTASLNILSGSTGQAKVLIVGGGGTGANTGTVTTNGGATSWGVVTTGGGGAGGVVYYNQFPISSGSYTIGIGKATSGPGGFLSPDAFSGTLCGLLGQPSWLKLPSNRIYAPFTSSYLIANGGGGANVQASFTQISPSRVFINDFGGQNSTSSLLLGNLVNGSGGGGGNVRSSTTTGGTPGGSGGNAAGGVDMGGLNGADQGTRGGIGLGGASIDGYCIDGTGVGGGGAGAAGADRQLEAGGVASSGGGNGLQFNLTDTSTYYAGGGGGRAASGGTTDRGLGDFGCGGNGSLNGNNQNGQAGVVIIAIPKCTTDLNVCTEYRILGGATGGTITYIPCGTDDIASASIDFGFTGSICTFKVGTTYPVSTGTVTLTQTGSCNTFIPLQPTITCTGSQVKTPAFIYDWEVPQACYPTQANCQSYRVATSTINYVDYLGVSQSVTVGGGFGSNTGQICARELPTPTILCNLLTGEFGNCAITKSSLVCGFFCSGSV